MLIDGIIFIEIYDMNASSSDLSALSYMPYLLELDASHNLLGHLLDFAPPKNIKSANFSFNQIEEMGDLSEHHYLTKLVLDNNELTQVKNRSNPVFQKY